MSYINVLWYILPTLKLSTRDARLRQISMNDLVFFQSPHATSNSSATCTWKAQVKICQKYKVAHRCGKTVTVFFMCQCHLVLSIHLPQPLLFIPPTPYLLASLTFCDHIHISQWSAQQDSAYSRTQSSESFHLFSSTSSTANNDRDLNRQLNICAFFRFTS